MNKTRLRQRDVMKVEERIFPISGSLSLRRISFLSLVFFFGSSGNMKRVTNTAINPRAARMKKRLSKPNSAASTGPTMSEITNAVPIIIPVSIKDWALTSFLVQSPRMAMATAPIAPLP